METTALSLPADLATAVNTLMAGAVIPLITAILVRPTTPKAVKRWLPIALAVLAAGLIVLFQAGGAWTQQVTTWIVTAATVTGLAHALYAAMPAQWKAVSDATSPASEPTGRRARRDND